MKLFEDLPSQNRPINAENLNQIQDNLVVVSATEPTGDNREKVWMQPKTDGNKIYILNDNGVYEEFVKKEGMGILINYNLLTNLGVEYYANQLTYMKIGKIVFCYLIINTRTKSNVTDEFYVEMPFTFKNDWYFPMVNSNIRAETNYKLAITRNSNKLHLVSNNERVKYKCNELPNGYLIDCQFFAFVE